MTYFNTTHLKDMDLIHAITKAENQNDAVYNIFKVLKSASPSKVWKHYNELKDEAPLTSIRRSISTLSKDVYDEDGIVIREAVLLKTEDKTKGIYGKDEFIWRIKIS